MNFNEYQEEAMEMAVYPGLRETDLTYPTLGLMGEAGEVAEKVKKLIRNKNMKRGYSLAEEDKEALVKELGDVLWYVAALSNALDFPLEHVAIVNINKLRDRKERDVIKSEGDNR